MIKLVTAKRRLGNIKRGEEYILFTGTHSEKLRARARAAGISEQDFATAALIDYARADGCDIPSRRPRAGATRAPLERMMRLHDQLRAGQFPNCRKVATNFETSPRTIQRDIDFMRDGLGLPIVYDARRFGFYYSMEPDCGFIELAATSASRYKQSRLKETNERAVTNRL